MAAGLRGFSATLLSPQRIGTLRLHSLTKVASLFDVPFINFSGFGQISRYAELHTSVEKLNLKKALFC
jgi:hypothetical protein